MKKVMVFGTFDILHPGHISFLRQAKRYGDFLVIVVGRDKTVKKIKGKLPKNKERKRLKQIEKLKIANKIVLGHIADPYKIIKEEKPDVICLGYDQNSFVSGLPMALKKLKLKIKVVRLKAYKPEIYKTSKILNN